MQFRRALAVGACLTCTATPSPARVIRYKLTVPAASEREVCEYLEVRGARADETLAGWTLHVHASTREATSHHAFLFDATGHPPLALGPHEGTVSACSTAPLPLLIAAYAPHVRLALPPGIRLPWHPLQALVLDLHVVNGGRRRARFTLRVALRLTRAAPGDRLAQTWGFLGAQIAIPPFTQGPAVVTATFPALALLTLNGHMHSRGLELVVTRDGAPWYRELDWQHPSVMRFDPPLDVTGQTVTVTCLYDNGVTRPVRQCAGVPCTLVFGLLADDAMCGIAGYAIPLDR